MNETDELAVPGTQSALVIAGTVVATNPAGVVLEFEEDELEYIPARTTPTANTSIE